VTGGRWPHVSLRENAHWLGPGSARRGIEIGGPARPPR